MISAAAHIFFRRWGEEKGTYTIDTRIPAYIASGGGLVSGLERAKREGGERTERVGDGGAWRTRWYRFCRRHLLPGVLPLLTSYVRQPPSTTLLKVSKVMAKGATRSVVVVEERVGREGEEGRIEGETSCGSPWTEIRQAWVSEEDAMFLLWAVWPRAGCSPANAVLRCRASRQLTFRTVGSFERASCSGRRVFIVQRFQ